MSRVTLPEGFLTQSGSLIDDFSDITGWSEGGTAADSVITESTDFYDVGSKSILFDTNSTTGNRFITENETFNLTPYGGMYFSFYNAYKKSGTAIGLTIYLSHAADLSGASGRWSISLPDEFPPGWNTVFLKTSDFSVLDGSPDFANDILSWRVRIDGSAGVIRKWYADSAYLGRRSRPKVIIAFDDGWETSYTNAHSYANAAGVPLTHYVIPSLIDSAGYITKAQLLDMQSNGDHIGLHDNTIWNDISTAADRIENRKNLLSSIIGNEVKHAAWPTGDYGYVAGTDGSIIDQALTKLSTIRGVNPTRCAYPQFEMQKGVLPAHGLSSSESLADAKAFIDTAIMSGGTAIFYGHKIDTTADGLTWATSDFEALIDYVVKKREQGLIDCETIDTWNAGLPGRRINESSGRITA